jgi:hypothetical protein
MKKTDHASLLHFLKPQSGPFYLDVTLGGSRTDGDRSSPFAPPMEGDPLSRVIQGRIMTDGGTILKDVLLLLQRDEYGLVDDSLSPLTNLDVERAFQQAFSTYLRESKGSLLLFSGLVNQTGGLVAMDPLFFCNRTGLFFPPPCPVCGLPLEQCEDDGLLTIIGLKPYTRSLKRYLFCEACSHQDRLRFYAYETGASEPRGVENRFALIKRFGSLLNFTEEVAGFPCKACEFADECYGTDEKVLSSVVPFAFYPFYMLILSPPNLSAWAGERKAEKEDLLAAREEALRLGWSLLTSVGTAQKNEPPPLEANVQKMEMLRDGTKECATVTDTSAISAPSVTEGNKGPAEEISVRSATNDEVVRLLSEIREAWQNRPSKTPSEPLPEVSEDDMEESVETVFLSLSDLEEIGSPSVPEKEDRALETILQSSARTGPPEDTEKTVILSAPPAQKEIDFEKTVILNVGQPAEPAQPSAPAAPVAENKVPVAPQQVEMEETVIISAHYGVRNPSPGITGGAAPATKPVPEEQPKKPPVAEDEGDLLEATVILKIDDRPKTKGNR